MPYIKVNKNTKTLLKTHPIDNSLEVKPEGYAAYQTSDRAAPLAAVKVIRDVARHARIEFDPHLTIAGKQYKHLYIFTPHWEGVTALLDLQVASATPMSPAGSSTIERTAIHYIQNNNHDWADDGSASNLRYGGVQCGLTSAAITLSESGLLLPEQHAEIMRLSPTGKFDDGVAAIFKQLGAQSISMEGHAAVFKYFGMASLCTRTATLAELKQHLEKVACAVLGTIYKDSGHFVAATGFDIKANTVKLLDPFGKRNRQSTNQWDVKYTKEEDAKPDWWPADMMADLWASQKDGWCVLPTPKSKPIVLAPPTQATGKSDGMMTRTAAMNATIPPGASRVLALQSTTLKSKPVMGSTLPDAEKDTFDTQEGIIGIVSQAPGDHVLITLIDDGKIKGRNTWYAYKKHLTIETPGGSTLTTAAGAAITDTDIDKAAQLIGVEPRALKAVMMVEAAGGGFLPSKRAKILFEAHWFSDFTNGAYDSSHPEISSRSWNPDLYIGGEMEWGRLEEAMKLDRAAAIKSASWGLGQLMGAHCAECPALESVYKADADRWMADNNHSEGKQLEVMAIFISDNPAMLTALKNKNWAKFAYLYNGEGYAANQYDIKLADAYADLG